MILLTTFTVSATPINTCTRISVPGEYILIQDILNSDIPNCITIAANDVVFDGAGHIIDGDGQTNYGILTNGIVGTVIKNVNLRDWNTRSINIISSNSGFFENITISGGDFDGFYLKTSNNNTLRNITVVGSGHVGFTFDSSYGNRLSNSLFQHNPWEDFDIYITGGIASCDNVVSNVSLTKHQLHYYNSSVTLRNEVVGSLYLCNADNSLIENVIVDSTNEQNSISNYYVENSVYRNITTIGLREAIFFKNSEDNEVINIVMRDGWNGISYSTGTRNINYNNATIYNMSGRAVRIYGESSSNIIRNSRFYNNAVGIYINTMGKNGANTIYNSYFNNTQNIEWGIPDFFGNGIVYFNNWNIAKTPGTNIISGLYLGGNFWASPSGNGYSQICDDSDSDGICNIPYTVGTQNIDYFPLSSSTNTPPPTPPPTPTNTPPPPPPITPSKWAIVILVIIISTVIFTRKK